MSAVVLMGKLQSVKENKENKKRLYLIATRGALCYLTYLMTAGKIQRNIQLKRANAKKLLF